MTKQKYYLPVVTSQYWLIYGRVAGKSLLNQYINDFEINLSVSVLKDKI